MLGTVIRMKLTKFHEINKMPIGIIRLELLDYFLDQQIYVSTVD